MSRFNPSELAWAESDYYRLGAERYRPRSAVGLGREIRRLSAEGYTARDIGAALGVSPQMVAEALTGEGAS